MFIDGGDAPLHMYTNFATYPGGISSFRSLLGLYSSLKNKILVTSLPGWHYPLVLELP